MITFACASCGKKLSVKDELAGKTGSCPHCKQKMTVPGGQRKSGLVVAPPAPAASPEATLGSLAPQEATAAAVTAPAAEDYDFLAPPLMKDELGRLGPYRVLKILGSGGMGVVFLAEDPSLKRQVALKALKPGTSSPSTKKRFIREAQTTASIKHDHIVSIYQVGQDRGAPFLAMELLEGEALDDRIKREGKLPIAEVLRIGRETAEGLSAAHEKGLIHRDIKPQNLWLEKPPRSPPSQGGARGGRVKILDFGLARATDDDTQLTASGAIVGTPAFMAPEQASGEKVDHRCDLFSLGCVLYRLCTGELPFKGTNTMAIILSLSQDHPKPPRKINPEVPPALSELIMKLLEKKREKRLQTAQAVVEALQAIEEVQTQIQTARSTSAEKKPAAQTTAKVSRSLLKVVASVLFLIVRLVRIPGRAGLVIKGVAGVLLLGLIALIVWPKAGSKPDGAGSDSAKAGSNSSKTAEQEKQITNSIGMKLVLIPAGEFLMGSPENEEGRKANEGPQHKVRITKSFHMGTHEVNQRQFELVMAKNPSSFKDSPELPVNGVTWYEAVEFCNKLSERPEEKKAGRHYRLPTEAEWEYSCRAGSKTTYFFGEDAKQSSQYAWFNSSSGGKTHPVGQLKPNTWGLYDMHGNVFEWCLDGLRDYAWNDMAIEDPKGKDDTKRIFRGGSYGEAAGIGRSALRYFFTPDTRNHAIGFRIVCVMTAKTP